MVRPKGRTNKRRIIQEKYKIIKLIIEGKKSGHDAIKETELSNGMIWNWIKDIENKRKPGNPLLKYLEEKNSQS